MKKCPHCGVSQQDDALFCDACGHPFPVHKSKPGLSRLCLAGFISSTVVMLAILYMAIYLFIIFSDSESAVLFSLFIVSFVVSLSGSIAGFILSIAGMVKAGNKKQKGAGFGIAGVAESAINTIATSILMVYFFAVLAFVSVLAKGYSDKPLFSAPDRPAYETESPWNTETSEDTFNDDDDTGTTFAPTTMEFGSGPEMIRFWSENYNVPQMVSQYIKQNPEFGERYTVECLIIEEGAGSYEKRLDNSLDFPNDSSPDIYVVEQSSALKYTKGDMSMYAATYKELGIDVDAKIKEADIAQYTIDIGSRNGEVVALGYEGTGGVMIYNAEIAKEVFGSDDPSEIEKITGAGTGNWDKFFEAATKLKEKGYAAVSGPNDIWNACEKSADTAWIIDDQLNIDPKREQFLDIAKQLKDNGWSNNTVNWSEGWFDDMMGKGERKVFAFFGPAWLINYVMIGNSGGYQPDQRRYQVGQGTYGQWRVCAPPVGFFWGGTWFLANKNTKQQEGVAELIEWITLDTSETGLQYLWANGLVDWDNDPDTVTDKDTVASAAVMAKSEWTLEFCGNQDLFPAFITGNKYASAKCVQEYDRIINDYFKDAAYRYADGEEDRDEAIENFKTSVYDNL